MSSLSLPNIALVLVDDMNVDDIHVMHRTRRGLNIEFANAFTTTPLCCPSRASFFSGRHQPTNNLGGCYNDTWIFGSERRTFAVHAKAAGYTTSLAGKYLNNYALAGSHEGCARSRHRADAITLPQHRVDGVESPRHRADAATEATGHNARKT